MSLLKRGKKAYLVLDDGVIFEGFSFGAEGTVSGEIVFNTSVVGFQENLTDPNYKGKLVVQTFPLVGNYGVNSEDNLTDKCHLSGYIVREWCDSPSNFRMEDDIDSFMKKNGVIGIYGIDTRRLTRIIRERGTVRGIITNVAANADESSRKELVSAADTAELTEYYEDTETKVYSCENPVCSVAVINFGAKKSLIDSLTVRGCKVTVLNWNKCYDTQFLQDFDGFVLSDGPCSASNYKNTENSSYCIGKAVCESGKPVFALGLGHLLLATANGLEIDRLHLGHRGSNHPVIEIETGRTLITTQNHREAVNCGSVADKGFTLTHKNANDGSCEGISYSENIFSVQFDPEPCGGRISRSSVWDKFAELVKQGKESV